MKKNVYLTAKEICALVKKQYSVKYTSKGLTSLLHQMGNTYKKPKHIPGKANNETQQVFNDQYKRI